MAAQCSKSDQKVLMVGHVPFRQFPGCAEIRHTAVFVMDVTVQGRVLNLHGRHAPHWHRLRTSIPRLAFEQCHVGFFPWTVARRPRCDAYLGVFALQWPRPAVQELESIFSTCVSALNLPVCESAMSAYFVFWGSVTRRPYRSSRGPVHTSDGFRSDSRMHGNVAKNLCERATR